MMISSPGSSMRSERTRSIAGEVPIVTMTRSSETRVPYLRSWYRATAARSSPMPRLSV